MINENWIRKYKEEIGCDLFEVTCRDVPGKSKENQKISARKADLWVNIWTKDSPYMKYECYIFIHNIQVKYGDICSTYF